MQHLKREPIEEMEEEVDAGSLVDSVSLDDVTSMEPLNTCDVIVTNVSQCSEPGQQKLLEINHFESPCSSFIGGSVSNEFESTFSVYISL